MLVVVIVSWFYKCSEVVGQCIQLVANACCVNVDGVIVR